MTCGRSLRRGGLVPVEMEFAGLKVEDSLSDPVLVHDVGSGLCVLVSRFGTSWILNSKRKKAPGMGLGKKTSTIQQHKRIVPSFLVSLSMACLCTSGAFRIDHASAAACLPVSAQKRRRSE